MRGRERPVGDDDLLALVDGRLDPDRVPLINAYLDERPELATRVRLDTAARERLRSELRAVAEEPVPARLRIAAIAAERRQARRVRAGWAAAACLCLALGATGGWLARDAVEPSGPAVPPVATGGRWAELAGDALSAHRTFAAEIRHPVEVKADEEAHLGQWLSKRLGRRLVIPDLESFGLQLVGGRLLPAGRRDVAAFLMYADPAGQRLTVYVRSGETGESAFRYLREGDLSSFAWAGEGRGYVVAATFERERLQGVARAIAQEFDMEAARRRPSL